ncbi:hypothetical protein MP228_002507 [Amoeboaphelidium protococcarum]|nr:hypothetical protein MP228_002507 [Amoeboaphelidium protococcarum]
MVDNFVCIKERFNDYWIGGDELRQRLTRLHKDSIVVRVVSSLFIKYYLVSRLQQSDAYNQMLQIFQQGEGVVQLDTQFLHLSQNSIETMMRPFRGSPNDNGLDYNITGPDYPGVNTKLREFVQRVIIPSQLEIPRNDLMAHVLPQIASEYFTHLQNHVQANFLKILSCFVGYLLRVECQYDALDRNKLVKEMVRLLQKHENVDVSWQFLYRCVPADTPLAQKQLLRQRVLSIQQKARWLLRQMYNDFGALRRVTNENFDQYLVLAYCMLRHVEDLAHQSAQTASLPFLLPQFSIAPHHIKLTDAMFRRCNEEPVLRRRGWASEVFNTRSFQDKFTGHILTDMHSVSFIIRAGNHREAIGEGQLQQFLIEENIAAGDNFLEVFEDGDENLVDENGVEVPQEEHQPALQPNRLDNPDFTRLPQAWGTKYLAIDPGIRVAVALAGFEYQMPDQIPQDQSPLDQFNELNQLRELQVLRVRNLGQHDVAFASPPVLGLPAGVTRRTVNLERIVQYCQAYLSQTLAAVDLVLQGERRETRFQSWQRRRDQLLDVVKTVLGVHVLEEATRDKYVVFFGAAAEHAFAGFGRRRLPPLVEFRRLLNRYAIVALTPEPYSSQRCSLCNCLGTRHPRPHDQFVCIGNKNHQRNGDTNAAANILYIGLHMMMMNGQFPRHFLNI